MKSILFIVFAFSLALSGSAIAAEQKASPINETDKVSYNGTETKFRKNEAGQHVYASTFGGVRVFDPKTHTLSVPMDNERYVLKVDAEKTAAGWEKTYYTRPVIGTGCPVDLFWKVNHTTSKETTEVSIDGKQLPFETETSVQKGTWACGQYGGGWIKMTTVYSADLDILVSFAVEMEYNGKVHPFNVKLTQVQRGTTPPAETKTASTGGTSN